LVIASASSLVDGDIRNVWQATAARSELLYERRQGRSKLLLVRDLDVRYGDVRVLFDVNLEVEEGQIIALLGTNGAGKSTLLRAISGVVEADGGAVVLDGRDITHAPPNEIARLGVGQVPGGQGVFGGLSVTENLRAAAWMGRRRAREAEDRLAEVIEMFPVLGERLEDPAADLSGGQQQQLALAMAFLSRPQLLLVDELSLGLAPVVVEQLVGILRRINEAGTTVILVEQSVNVALTLADTAYFMEKGEIRFHGPTSELLERPDVLRSVFLEGAQAGLDVAAHGSSSEVRVGDARPAAPAAPAGGGLHEAATPALELRELWVRFGGIRAVDDVSLAVAPGEVVGLIGPNGAGKTTLFDLTCGFTRAGGGQVLVAGRDLTRAGPESRATAGLGRSFQDARLFPSLTVAETIATALHRWVDVRDPFNAAMRLPVQQDSEQAVHWYADLLIDLLGLGAFRSKLVGELSTGSRRVVDLACVLALRPSVVMLDEPSSGIAQREAEALAPLIVRIRDTLGASVMVIEHDMPLVSAVSDRLVALDQGRVVTEGTADEVLAHPEVVASYLGTTDEVIARSGPSGGATSPAPTSPVTAPGDELP
jgi:branched-chain amino acid transport system ATP-binding protein